MSETSTEFLTRFFVEELDFTPTARQIDQFQSDLSLVSPFLMEASLKEAKEGVIAARLVSHPAEWRSRIFSVYNRKVGEHAQLFPIFHTFETAFRSTVAVTLEDHYQHPRWWRGIYDALRKGHLATTIGQVGGVVMSKDAAHRIGEIIYSIDGEDLRRRTIDPLDNGYQFTEICDVAHIRQLIEEHWSVFAPKFARGKQKLTLNAFQAKFNRVREARNDVYHHKSTANLTDVVASAEELLDYLNCSIRFVFEKLMAANVTPPTFALPIETRHNTWT